MIRAVAAVMVALLTATGCTGGSASSTTAPATDWSSDLMLMTAVDGKPTLLGLNVKEASLRVLTQVPFTGDLRVDAGAQLLHRYGSDLVTLGAGSAAGSSLWRVDKTRRVLDRVAVLQAALHLAPVANALVGVGPGRGDAYLAQKYGLNAQPQETRALAVDPSWSGADLAAEQTCYAGQDAAGKVAFERDGWRPVSRVTGHVDTAGNLTGVACSRSLVVLAIGDLPLPSGRTTPDGRLTVTRNSGAGVCIVSPQAGSSGRVTFDGERVLADAPLPQGRQLVQVDCSTGTTSRTAPLPEIGDVQAIVPLNGVIVVVGTDRVFLVDAQTWATKSVAPIGDLLPMEIQVAADR